MDLLNLFVNMFLPVLTMAVTFAAYTLIQKKPLTASSVFASMVIFENLKGVMGLVIFMVGNYITSGVSLNRLNKFLNDSDMIDVYSQGVRATVQTPDQLEAEANGLIRLRNATFAWGEDTGNKNIINFRLRVPDVTFAKGKVNLITGPTGSGKSSFLAALTGELHFEPIDNTSFFHLPREGGVSFAAQESWCMSDSIKDNILFGSPYNEARYRQVLHDCALEPDLKLFDDGDQTEIGERGVTLSGGQKARITLARAIYANTSVVLLDDIFSALDTLTSRFILENLFKGDLVRDRTVVVVVSS
jgi:ABC-type multidrug transport system fused ATPase/permease subunit